MNIAALIFFYLWAPLLVRAEDRVKQDVHKINGGYNNEELHHLYNFTKENCTFYVNWRKSNSPGYPKKLVIVAQHGGKVLQQYSMESYIINPEYSDDTIIKELQENIQLELFFDFQTTQIHTDQFFLVKYFQKSISENGLWWCDVYKTYAYSFTQVEKCVYVIHGMEAMLDPYYNSVNTDLQDGNIFVLMLWDKCKGTQSTICTDQFTGVKINQELWCRKNVYTYSITAMGYKIVLYYEDYVLGSYTLSNSEDLKYNEDTRRACKLFNFAIGNNSDKMVYVQFMNKTNGTEHTWEYKCHSYRRVFHKYLWWLGRKSYVKTTGESTCDEYRSHRDLP